MPRGNTSADRVREVYDASYRRLVGQLTGVTGDPIEAEESYADMPEDRVALLAALRQLPAAQREAIALHHLADLSVAEVADTVGAPVGTVKARLARGRTALATLLAEPETEGSPR